MTTQLDRTGRLRSVAATLASKGFMWLFRLSFRDERRSVRSKLLYSELLSFAIVLDKKIA